MWKFAVLIVVLAGAGGWLIVARVTAASTRSEAAQLAAVLELHEGSRVADVGAGKGAVALELARHVGPTGHVFATEIDDKRRREIQSAAAQAGLDNLSVIEAAEMDTGLERNCCDAIFLRGVYHHVTKPMETNASLHRALRPGGRLVHRPVLRLDFLAAYPQS